ncbi:Endoglucanase 8 [Vitis vinifera]|uniref:cellulase n=1 Tax=Vitis vinifera TaxID=29760 RepID=A0A438IRZ3_VITVI|nr:Endoglucanase 8 [Vitis vinifera]
MGLKSVQEKLHCHHLCANSLRVLGFRIEDGWGKREGPTKGVDGQRSGRLPPSQRMTWRKDSALNDGTESNVDLVGGYYDAGDNVKFNFPMAFTTTLLAWSVLEFGQFMGSDLQYALDAIRWGTDYFLKATSIPGTVFAIVGDPYGDHSCWQRPEDMDTPRTSYAVTTTNPGSESQQRWLLPLQPLPWYFRLLMLNIPLHFSTGLQWCSTLQICIGVPIMMFLDELIWAAAWLYKATNNQSYWDYVLKHINSLPQYIKRMDTNGMPVSGGSFAEFGWDSKHAGINILVSKLVIDRQLNPSPFVFNADKFACSILPESPTKSVTYSPGGLLFKPGSCNMQHVTALSFLLLVYSRYSNDAQRGIQCDNFVVPPSRLVQVAQSQGMQLKRKEKGEERQCPEEEEVAVGAHAWSKFGAEEGCGGLGEAQAGSRRRMGRGLAESGGPRWEQKGRSS